jgi:8-oxo-dGTP pyrophosphatase MutT (NUDIX family)
MSSLLPGEPDSIHQASAVPFRRKGDRLEFCLITSSAGRWGFPKGLIDPGDTYIDTALKEAHEEAGLHGQILGEPLGAYVIVKRGVMLKVIVLLMEVTQVDKDWAESKLRQRRWVSRDKADELVSQPELRALLAAATVRLFTSESH